MVRIMGRSQHASTVGCNPGKRGRLLQLRFICDRIACKYGPKPLDLLFLINKTQKLGKSEENLPQNKDFSRFYSADIENEREFG
jgi:hypothetical protein